VCVDPCRDRKAKKKQTNQEEKKYPTTSTSTTTTFLCMPFLKISEIFSFYEIFVSLQMLSEKLLPLEPSATLPPPLSCLVSSL